MKIVSNTSNVLLAFEASIAVNDRTDILIRLLVLNSFSAHDSLGKGSNGMDVMKSLHVILKDAQSHPNGLYHLHWG